MIGREFIAKVRKLGRATGTEVRVDSRSGKGSHIRLYFGDRWITVKDPKKEVRMGTFHAMCRQLGIDPKDIRGG